MIDTHAPTSFYILDGIGPFFRDVPDGRINWSKIPFASLEREGQVDRDRFRRIREDFEAVCARAVEYGFNSISLDDLAHLTDHPAYPPDLRERIAAYREEFAHLFEIAARHGLRVLVTTDISFFNATLDAELGRGHRRIVSFLEAAVDELFRRFPRVSGLITRIGESDGLDVEGDFRSRLVIRNPGHARRYLDALLPVFERHDRWWIFRTWSVGAYRIGDLIWNRVTFQRVFGRVRSSRLIISMKHGESDFFRYLPLNKQFFRGELPRIIELQARREYEGAGEYPSFIGADYEAFRNRLRDVPTMRGAMVWCQTGGWIRFRRLTFLSNSSVWNEINTWVSIRLFRDGVTAAEAVERWRQRRLPAANPERLLRLLRLSDEVVSELLYVDDFARRKIFFRRLRIPPLLAVFWDHVIVSHPMRQLLRSFVRDGEAKILQGQRALEKIREMRELAIECGLPVADIDFMHDTFEVLAATREYYFREFSPAMVERLTALREAYRAKHGTRYAIHLDFRPFNLSHKRLRTIAEILFRRQRGYRLLDRIFTIRLLGWLYPVIRFRAGKSLPSFSRKQAMGIDTLFR